MALGPLGGNGLTDGWKISLFYRTLSPIGAAAQKGGEGEERESKRHEKERDVVATIKMDKSII